MKRKKRVKGPKPEKITVREHTRKRGKLPGRTARGRFKSGGSKKPKGGGQQSSLF